MATKKKATTSSASGATKTRSRSTTRKKTASKAGAKKKSTSRSKAKAPAVADSRVVVEREIGGRTLTLETGRMAKLSDGACLARYGDTMVLAAVNSSKAPDGIDFFPLTVDYREKTAAAGMIPGGFFKREGRPTTKEILACRIIDRSIRPMFPDGFRRDVQVLSQVLSADRENDPDVIAAVASFAALALSSLPHGRTLGMVRIGCVDGELVVNPLWSSTQSEENKLNLTVAGHDEAVVMVEAGAREVSEDTVLDALELAHSVIRDIVEMVEELVEKAGKPTMEFDPPMSNDKVAAAIDKEFGAQLREAPLTLGPKQVRGAAIKEARDAATAAFPPPEGTPDNEIKPWKTMVSGIVNGIVKQSERDSILGKGVRADGRDNETVRPITIEVGVLPCTHGSVLFTRGETQALAVVTLGGTEDQQIIDGLMPEPRKRFLLHYAFPPFSVGETKRMLAPGRREIGHGALAERGLEPVLPTREEFPYTIRVTGEILESNGSSSMATACGGTLAMMDAGVPIQQPVAGIAMGLVKEGKKYKVLSDILGSEDACGDMDFKVVGTGRGITALQMDIKCEGLTREILAEALEQAREGRLHILREMLKALKQPRQQLSPNAPRLLSVQVPPDKIGTIIGPGGKNIRMLQETYECKISIEDSGLCTITGLVGDKVDAAIEYVSQMTAEVEMGSVYEGTVSAIKEFGAFVEILPGQEGLVHVSELSNDFIRTVTDVVRIGDKVKVKVIAIDDFGKIKLSRKALLEGGDESASDGYGQGEGREERRPRRDREERDERRPRRDREDREERRPRRDREERDERRPRRDREERDESRPRRDREERDESRPRRDREERDESRPRRDREERGERRPRRDREDRDERRPRRDREDREGREEHRARGEREYGDDRRPRRDREERGGRDRDDYDGDRGERRPRRERPERGERRPRRDDGDRDEGGPKRDSGRDEIEVWSDDEDSSRAPRGDRSDREAEDRPARRGRRGSRDDEAGSQRAPRADDDEQRPRGGRRERSDRGRPERSMPMAEFGDGDESGGRFPDSKENVGELESIDSLLGEESERSERRPRRSGGRRPRRD